MQALSSRTVTSPGFGILSAATPFRAAFCALLAAVLGCAPGSPTTPRPEPVLSGDSMAEVRLRELAERWHAASPEQRLQLEVPLRQYLEQFPYDAPRRRVWVYLAWILVQKGELLEAREWIDRAKPGPPGSVADFGQVTEAALLLELNQPHEALRQLRPLRGKLIDPVERFLLTEQLVLAAMAAELYGEALVYMVDWAAAAPVTERAAVQESIVSHLHRVPRRHLERALDGEADTALPRGNTDPRRREQEQWVHSAIARRLTAIAVEERDPDLARFVLERGSDLGSQGDEAQELMDLATSTESGRHVRGRTIGLVLATGSEAERLRSSEVAAAVAAALGLPRAARDPEAARLVFAEDAGGPSGATAAFQSLGTQGAAIVIAGFDAGTAEQHSWQAERVGIPTLLLHPHELDTPRWCYTLGVSSRDEREVLETALRARGLSQSRLVEGDDVCEPATERAVLKVVNSWADGGSDSALFLGTRACAELVLKANSRAKRPIPIALGFSASAAASRSDPAHVALSPGAYPFEAHDARLGSWLERHASTPSWYEALAHDAALLANAVLSQLPAEERSGSNAVSAHHDRVRALLQSVRPAALWTSDQGGFDAELVLRRHITVSSTGIAEAP